MKKQNFYDFISFFIPGIFITPLIHYENIFNFAHLEIGFIHSIYFVSISIIVGLIIQRITNWISGINYVSYLFNPKINSLVKKNTEIIQLLNEINQLKNTNLNPEQLFDDAFNELEYINKADNIKENQSIIKLFTNALTIVFFILIFILFNYFSSNKNINNDSLIFIIFSIILLLVWVIKWHRIKMITIAFKKYLFILKKI